MAGVVSWVSAMGDVMPAIEREPWEQNACFTIKADSREEVGCIAGKLDRYARRIGAGAMFCDYEGPQSEGSGDSRAR